MNQRITYTLIGILFLLGFFYRVDVLISHSSEADEHFPAVAVLASKAVSTEDFIHKALYDQQKSNNYNSKYKVFLRKLDTLGLLSPIIPVINLIKQTFTVPFRTTYAPLQFIFTRPLYFFDSNWVMQDYLLWNRLPSLIFDCASFFFIIIFGTSLLKQNELAKIIFLIIWGLVWTHSLELRNFAVNMSSYAAGVTGITLLMWWQTTLRKGVATGVIMGVILNMHYATLPFILAYFVSNIFLDSTNEPTQESIKNRIIASVKKHKTSLLIFSLVFLVDYILFLGRVKLGNCNWWYEGKNGDFLFSRAIHQYWYSALVFFPKNLYLVISCLFSDHVLTSNFSIFFSIITLFTLWGILQNLKVVIKRKKYILPCRVSLYIATSYLFYFVFVALSIVPFGPSRHSLVLLPFLTISLFLGIWSFVALISKHVSNSRLVYSVSIFAFAYSIFYVSNVYSTQKAISSEPTFSVSGIKAINEFNPDLIIGGYDKIFMLRNNFPTTPIAYLNGEFHRLPSIYWIRPLKKPLPDSIRIVIYNSSHDRDLLNRFKSKLKLNQYILFYKAHHQEQKTGSEVYSKLFGMPASTSDMSVDYVVAYKKH